MSTLRKNSKNRSNKNKQTKQTNKQTFQQSKKWSCNSISKFA